MVQKKFSNRENQVKFLMIPNGEGCKANIHGQWHYLAIKKLYTLLKIITSKHSGDFYCVSCLQIS